MTCGGNVFLRANFCLCSKKAWFLKSIPIFFNKAACFWGCYTFWDWENLRSVSHLGSSDIYSVDIFTVVLNIKVAEIVRRLLLSSRHYPYPHFNICTRDLWPPIVGRQESPGRILFSPNTTIMRALLEHWQVEFSIVNSSTCIWSQFSKRTTSYYVILLSVLQFVVIVLYSDLH